MSFSHLISNTVSALQEEAQALREADEGRTGTRRVSLTWGQSFVSAALRPEGPQCPFGLCASLLTQAPLSRTLAGPRLSQIISP